ncbi:MAG: hypothetical protein IJC43_08530 [Clostridia bacterium]|nr:hypothetical protein [Clostridia bacterium]
MAAIRLYYEDAYLTETVTDITACIEEEGRMLVTLKESLFHAQGGGQPADRGTIDGVPVLDVFDREGELYHVVERAPEKREGVVLKLDWDYRYDVMRQHTGQHLLSAAILHRFGVTTTISRGEDFVNQIDLERPLSDEQLREAERDANAVMAEGRKVRGFFVKPEEMEQYKDQLRKAARPHDLIRLVEIEDYDLMGCGGNHVRSTDEVGLIRVLYAKDVSDQKTARGCFRVYFLCGDRALQDYGEKVASFRRLSLLLGCDPDALEGRVEQLHAAYERLSARAKEMEAELEGLAVARLLGEAREAGELTLIRAALPGRDTKGLKAVAEAVIKERRCLLLLTGSGENGTAVVLAQPKGYSGHKLGERLKALLAETGAKGGGSPFFAQATLPAGEEAARAAERFFDALEAEIGG